MSGKEQPLISPKKGRADPSVGPVAVMVAMETDLALVRRAMDFRGRATGRIFTSKVFTGKTQGGDATVVGPMLGAPHAVMVLEKLVVLGAEKILFLGWCGSVQERVSIGDFVIPDRAVIGEGTSRYYISDTLKRESISSLKVAEAVENNCRAHTVPIHIGPVWSTDAPYRETSQKVLSLKRQGILGVDMESSALFTVSRFRQVEAGALLVVSDELASLRWKPGFSHRTFNASRKRASEIVAQACRALSNS
jgi:purine-nucleoside phosphorylase